MARSRMTRSGRRLRSDLPAQMLSAITSAGVRCITPMGNTIARKGNIAQVRRSARFGALVAFSGWTIHPGSRKTTDESASQLEGGDT